MGELVSSLFFALMCCSPAPGKRRSASCSDRSDQNELPSLREGIRNTGMAVTLNHSACEHRWNG